MNKKGQALVLFIILVPVFLVMSAIFVDMGINSHNDKKLKNITEDVMEVLLDDESINEVSYENEEEVISDLKKQAERIYSANDIDTEYLYIEVSYGGKVILSNTYTHYSFMNSLLGKANGNRDITISVEGYISDGKKVIEFEGGSNESK